MPSPTHPSGTIAATGTASKAGISAEDPIARAPQAGGFADEPAPGDMLRGDDAVDPVAAELVVDQLAEHVAALRRYALALSGDRSDADDLVQDCLLRVLAHARAWRPIRDVRAYLFTTLHHVFIDVCRRQRSRGTEIPVEAAVDDLVTGESQTGALELRDMMAGLRNLPADQREVVLLVGMEGMTYQQTADVLDIPIGTVMSRLSRGREALRRHQNHGVRPKLRVVK